MCVTSSPSHPSCVRLHVCMHQYRALHFKKLVQRLIIILKWMKSRQSKAAGPEIQLHKRTLLHKRSATLDITQRPARTTLSLLKKASSVDFTSKHVKQIEPHRDARISSRNMFACNKLVRVREELYDPHKHKSCEDPLTLTAQNGSKSLMFNKHW